jgi:hypothetical protein
VLAKRRQLRVQQKGKLEHYAASLWMRKRRFRVSKIW